MSICEGSGGHVQISFGRNPHLNMSQACYEDLLSKAMEGKERAKRDYNNERGERSFRCGCGGELVLGLGCIAYDGSDKHMEDFQHEGFMRVSGLGNGGNMDALDATMLIHLHDNGMDYDTAYEYVTAYR